MPRSHGEAILVKALKKAGVRSIRTNVQLGAQPNEADIVVERSKMVIEVDGPWHCQRDTIKRDAWKDQYYEDLGYRVFRVTTHDVRFFRRDVVREILSLLEECKPLPTRHAELRWQNHPQLRGALLSLQKKFPGPAA